jgi:hypothetical protein
LFFIEGKHERAYETTSNSLLTMKSMDYMSKMERLPVFPDCGGGLRKLGEDVSEVLEYVPACFQVIRHVRPNPPFSHPPNVLGPRENCLEILFPYAFDGAHLEMCPRDLQR